MLPPRTMSQIPEGPELDLQRETLPPFEGTLMRL